MYGRYLQPWLIELEEDMKKVIFIVIALSIFLMSGCSNPYESFEDKIYEGDYEAAADIYSKKTEKK